MGSAWGKEGPKKGGTPGEGVTPEAEGYHAKVGVEYSRKIGGGGICKKMKGWYLRKKMKWGGWMAEGNTSGNGNKTERHY